MAKGDRNVHVVTVAEGEFVPLPDNPQRVLLGPGRLEVTRRDDGRVYAIILDGTASTLERALRWKLKRVWWDV